MTAPPTPGTPDIALLHNTFRSIASCVSARHRSPRHDTGRCSAYGPNAMTTDTPHVTPSPAASKAEPGPDLKSAPMAEVEKSLGYSPAA